MAEFPLRIPTESTVGRSGQEAHVRLVNGYAEALGADQDGKAPFAIYARPGLSTFGTRAFGGVARTLTLLNNTTLLALLGTQLVSFDITGAPTVLGNITGTDRVTSALNENGTPQVAFVSDGGTYTMLQGGVFTNPVTGFGAPNSVAYLKGLFCFTEANGTLFHSNVNDGSTFNALAFGLAQSDPLALVRCVADAGYLYVFGTQILEIWQNAGTTPFALAPLQQYIPMGLLAKYSVAKGAANGLIWVDHRGIVRYGRDGGAQRISTHSIERAIEELSDADRPNLIGGYFVAQGHEYYTLSAPSEFTWVYNISNQRWYEWASNGPLNAFSRWIVNDTVLFNEHWLGTDYRNGTLYTMSADTYTDAGNDFIFEAWCPHVHAFRKGVAADFLDIDIVSGVGLSSDADAANVNPQLQVSFSDDGGNLFTGERFLPIGKTGQRKQLIRSGQWGRITPKGRIWKMRGSSAVLRGIIQAHVDGRQLYS